LIIEYLRGVGVQLDSYGRWGKATSDSLEWVRRTVGFRLFRVLFALSVLLPPALYTFRVYMRTGTPILHYVYISI
jgi:hypothetical protein